MKHIIGILNESKWLLKKSVGRLPIIKLVWLQFDLLQYQLNAKRELVCYHHLREDPVPKIGKWASSIPRWVESRGGAGEAGPGGRLPHVGARPLAGPHPPHIPGCPPPPAFPPPTATKASPHTQVSLLLNLDRGKVGGELHHHSGVPTGIQLSLVFARILGLIRKHLKVLTHASETCLIFWVYNTICRLCCMAVTSSTLMIN